MPRSLPSPTTLTFFAFLLAFPNFSNLSFSSSVHAQLFRPIPDSGRCGGFTEGQGLYIVGGYGTEANFTAQTFILDLSVSWNMNDPIFRKLSDGPKTTGTACTMINNGEDLFVLSRGTGYVYNVKSNSWTTIHSMDFPDPESGPVVEDPETGYIYIPQHANQVRSAIRQKDGTDRLYRIRSCVWWLDNGSLRQVQGQLSYDQTNMDGKTHHSCIFIQGWCSFR